jgi:hypothetical protein
VNHHHKNQSENEFTHQNSSRISTNLSSEELMKKTRRFTVDMFDIQNSTTAMIPEPEEIPTETIRIEPSRGITTGSRWFGKNQNSDGAGLSTVGDNVLNNTNSGIDLTTVRSLLGDEKNQCLPQNVFPVDTDTSVTIECEIPDEKVKPVKMTRIHETTDFSMLETIQTTGNVSSLIGNELSSINTELEAMRNPADYSRNSGNSHVPATGETAVRENLFETSSHVFDCYIENDSTGMHNQAYNQYLEPENQFSGTVVVDAPEGADSEKKGVFFGVFQKRNEARQELNKSIRQMVTDYPLLSEHELFEQVKDTEPFLNLKLNKKRLTKVLSRLKLSSGYERFRFFVKA